MRIRTIKPEFWQNEELSELSAETRLLAIGLLNCVDDEGYMKSHPALIKSQLFPFNEDSLNIQGMLNELSRVGFIRLLKGHDGKDYLHVVNFLKHQKVNRPSPSKINGFIEFTEHSVNGNGAITVGKERKGMEHGNGKEGNMEKEKEVFQSDKSDAIIVLSYMNSVLGTKYKETTISHIENINARISEGHTVDDCKAVIDHKKNEWQNDPKMAGYLRPQTLFQTGKFQGYLMAAKAQRPAKQSAHNLNGKKYESGDL